MNIRKAPSVPDYTVDAKPIGSGAYGAVYKAIHVPSQKVVVIKNILINSKEPNHDLYVFLKRLYREIKLLRMLKDHPLFVSLEHIVLPPVSLSETREINLIFNRKEFDLGKLFYSNLKILDDHIQYALYHILCAVNFLHSAHIIHRDLKLQNILCDRDFISVICDLNMARATQVIGELVHETLKASHTSEAITTNNSSSSSSSSSANYSDIPPPLPLNRALTHHVVTRWYRSPEIILLNNKYGPAVDMWSIGCILADLLLMHEKSPTPLKQRLPLFPGGKSFPLSKGNNEDDKEQLDLISDLLGTPTAEDSAWIHHSLLPAFSKAYSSRLPKNLYEKFYYANPLAIDLLKKLLVFNPAKRLTAREALNHPYLKLFANDEIQNLIFPLSPLTIDGVLTPLGASMVEYYQFEIEDEKNKDRYNDATPEMIADVWGRIRCEIQHYHPVSMPIDTKAEKIEAVQNTSAPMSASASASAPPFTSLAPVPATSSSPDSSTQITKALLPAGKPAPTLAPASSTSATQAKANAAKPKKMTTSHISTFFKKITKPSAQKMQKTKTNMDYYRRI